MKLNFNKIKESISRIDLQKVKTNTKEFAGRYHKIIGTVVAGVTMCAVCTVSFATRVAANNVPSGIMMTLSDVASTDTFSEENYVVAGITYDEMCNVTYETDQLAQLDKSERQIDEILSARNQDRKDLAALQELTASGSPAVNEYDPDYQGEVTPASSIPSVITPADANGNYEAVGTFTLTGYCPCPICCGRWSNMEAPTTASGTLATPGRTIAADTSVFPFGTKLMINGQIYVVEDVGGSISGNKIDIFFGSHQEALNFGRQSAVIYRVIE